MSMMRFAMLFPDVAVRETRTARVLDAPQPAARLHLPVDEYGFDEWYCVERGCDCRRVMINVLARNARAHLATINHAFEPPGKDDLVPEQTFLDPLNRQSQWSDALLDLFVNVVLADEAYRQRLLRHYRMFKKAVDDPGHPCQRIIGSFPESASSRRAPIPAPHPRRRKRKR